MAKYGFTFAAAAIGALADPISCPELLCEDPDPTLPSRHDLCFQHDGLQPSKYIRLHSCDWYPANGASKINGPDTPPR